MKQPMSKKIFITLFVVFAMVFLVGFGASAQAALVDCGNAVSPTDSSTGCKLGDILTTAFNLIEYMLGGAATFAVAGVVYGGVLMVTSAGNESRSAEGKKAVTNSLIGLAVILLAFLMVRTLFTVLGFDNGTEVLENPGSYINSGQDMINQ